MTVPGTSMPLGSGEEKQELSGSASLESPERRRTGARVHADVVVAGAIVALAAGVWAGTLAFPEVPAALTQGMGPGVFPRLIAALLILLALVLAWSARGRPDPQREPVPRMVPLTIGAVLAFMAVLQVLGIHAAILFATIGIGRLWGERRWWLLAASGIGLAIVTHLAFVTAFGIGLPRGMLGQWLS